MGDPRLAIGDEAPLDEWPTMSSPQSAPGGSPRPARPVAAQAGQQAQRASYGPQTPGGSHGPRPAAQGPQGQGPQGSYSPAHRQQRALAAGGPPGSPPGGQQGGEPADTPPTHVPWTVASTWGASSLNTPNTLAGLSYLFWWVSGLMVYFNERHNRFVRFHAVQSILLTGGLTVASVIFYMLWELSGDLSAATHQAAWAHLGQGIAFLGFLAVIAVWLCAMIAAWSGHHLRMPLVGPYAERYAAPPREPYPPSPFSPQ